MGQIDFLLEISKVSCPQQRENEIGSDQVETANSWIMIGDA